MDSNRFQRPRAWLARVLPLVLTLAVLPSLAAAQATTGTVTGRVVEQTGQNPILAAQVQIVGTNLGTQTNGEGQYTIRGVPAGQQRLRVIRVGFSEATQTVTVPAGGSVEANLTMTAVAVTLNPVVTTATGDTRRVEVGNAIAQINADKLVEQRPINSMGDLLTARAPGVQVLPSNTTGGGARVRIRGTSSLSLSNDPIYVIDGVRMQSSTGSSSIGLGGTTPSRVNDLNPDEIESIEVVKGPSAATLYGTDAANGVIVIKTKRGVSGKPQWTAFTEQGIIKDQNDWPTNYAGIGTLSSGNPTENCYLTRQAAGTCTLDSLAGFNVAKNDATSPLGTGHTQNYGLQLRGGSDNVRYFVSGEWQDEQGLQKLPSSEVTRLNEANIPIRDILRNPNQYNKASARANLNLTLPGNADLAFNAGYIQSSSTLTASDNNASGWVPTIVGGYGVVDPAAPVGAFGFYPVADVFQQQFEQGINRFIGSTNGNWRPASWLAFRGNFGLDYTNRVDTDLCRFTECTSGTSQEGYKIDNRSSFFNYTVDVSGTGTFQLSDAIGSKTTLGAQFYRDVFNRNGASGTRLPPGATTVSAGAVPSASEATTESRTLGAFVEQSLSFNERLFITGAVRSDDNSAFGRDFNAVYYPKLSVSWVTSDEPFFPSIGWLNQLRLRAAYGASGRQPGTTDAVQYFSTTTAIAGGVESPGLIYSALGNSELKPERSTELETGLDFNVWDSRVSGEFTYYNKSSKDALIQEIIPPSVGTGSTVRFSNLGEIRNTGIEYLLNAQLLQRDAFGWDVTLNGSHNSNEIVSLGNTPPQIGSRISQKEGYPLNAFFLKPYTYSDANGNGIIAPSEVTVAADPVFAGYSQPRTEISLHQRLRLLAASPALHQPVRLQGRLQGVGRNPALSVRVVRELSGRL